MIYGSSKYEVLHQGTYLGYKFFIISYGTHPCAYVENKDGYVDYECEKLLNVDVHGGFTFLGEKCGVECLGWDYNHYGDFSSYTSLLFDCDDKKWTTEEIYEEVKRVIKQLIELKEELLCFLEFTTARDTEIST